MGKITGFMDYKRKDCKREDSLSRLKHWNEFDTPLKEEERKESSSSLYGLWGSVLQFRYSVKWNGILDVLFII